MDGSPQAVFSVSTAATLEGPGGVHLADLHPMDPWTALDDGGSLELVGPGGESVLRPKGPVHVLFASSQGIPLVFLSGRWYRGTLEFRLGPRGIEGINVVPLESYLYGVVPEEMPPSWPMESLKAQAIAARTYALSSLGSFGDYDVKPTTESQVYGGASSERPSSDAAVDATRGMVVTYHGKVIRAYFCADAGGYTDDPEDVWGESYPYLRPVPDFDQESPRSVWHAAYSADSVRAALERDGVQVGDVRDLVPMDRSFAGRVKHLQVVGTAGTQVITGNALRAALGLYSTLFNVAPYDPVGGVPSAFAFAGRGWGHGLGLSQWGAKGLADRGYSCAQILAHYYPGTLLTTLP